jgi:hypothetical protein
MLLPAMIQASQPVSLTGPLVFVLLLALALALPISFVLIKLYRRAVCKSMGTRVSSMPTGPTPLVTSISTHPSSPELNVVDAASQIPTGSVAALYAEVLHAPWRLAAVYIVAGVCYAFIMSVAFLVSTNSKIFPTVLLFLVWINFWPIVLTVNLVTAATWRAKAATVTVYFLVLAALSAVAIANSPEFGWSQSLLLWVVFNLPSTMLLLTFLNRRIRSVGPLVLIFMIVTLLGSQVGLSLVVLAGDEVLRGIVSVGSIIGIGAQGIFYGLMLAGFLLVWPIGWLLLRWIRRLYERKKISDQSISLDAIWLLFGFAVSLMLASAGAIWIFTGLFAYLGFKLASWAGLRMLNIRTAKAKRAPRLLLLRVFSLGKRSERLFGALATHWRHVGSIELIAGPDLATNTLEPHEFLDFLSGKLARRFIDGALALDQRRSEMDTKPDQDGRFRVNDFFCHSDTWQMVLSWLVKESDAVVMDLRGFTSQNKGCVFEVEELINVAPLGRVVFIVDDTTDEHFLLESVRQSWARMKPTSPNRDPRSGQIQFFRFTGSRSGELRRLLRALCIAANPA